MASRLKIKRRNLEALRLAEEMAKVLHEKEAQPPQDPPKDDGKPSEPESTEDKSTTDENKSEELTEDKESEVEGDPEKKAPATKGKKK